MVNSLEISYLVFSQMDKDYQEDYLFTLNYMKNGPELKDYFSTVDLSDRSFIFVKQLEQAYISNNNEEIFQLITSLPEYKEEVVVNASAYKFLNTLKYILNRVEEIINIENEMLVSSVQSDDYSMYIEQIDFSMFPRYYSEVRELANNDITKFKEIEQMKYSDCLVELIFRQKQNDFERLVMKSYNNKSK